MNELLPFDLIVEILSRLFVHSLLRFRCVSKAWCRTIDDPSFVKLHLHRQSDYGHLIFAKDLYTLNYLNPDEIQKDDLMASPYKTLPLIRHGRRLPRHHHHSPYELLSTCNGLILMSSLCCGKLMWNPFTRETRMIPISDEYFFLHYLLIAFGYDVVNDDYKVVKIVDYLGANLTLVYSLKTNSWKRINNYNKKYSPLSGNYGVFENGAVHWLNSKRDAIIAFDLATEKYNSIPLPERYENSRVLRGLGECLLVTTYNSVYRLDNYYNGSREKYSWTKLFSFIEVGGGIGFDFSEPVVYLKNKGELLVRRQHGVDYVYYWVNVEKKTANKVTTIYGLDSIFWRSFYWHSIYCVGSLVRLREIKKSARFFQTFRVIFARLKNKFKREEKNSINPNGPMKHLFIENLV